jgi:hypothetical protein
VPKSAGDLGRSKKSNPYLTACKPLRKHHQKGIQFLAAALGNRSSELSLILRFQHREVPGAF